MADAKQTLADLVKSLKQERDELKVKMHLAGMDAKNEYDRLSEKYDELNRQLEPIKDAVEESAEGIFAALGLAADELKVGFRRVRDAIRDDEKSSS